MKIIKTKAQDSYLVATIESEPQVFDKHFLKHFKNAQSKVSIKGFRKGKVPIDMASQYVDYQKINEKTFYSVVNETIDSLKKSEKLHEYEVFDEVVKNEIVEFKSEEKILIFNSFFETKPNIELGDYSKIETIFVPKDLKKVYWTSEISEITDKCIVYVKINAYDEDNKAIFKYWHDVLEIDLETTNINKDIIASIKAIKTKGSKEFSVTIDKKKIIFKAEILNILEKKPIDDAALATAKNTEIKTVADLKKVQKENFNIQNESFAQAVIVKWANSYLNIMSHIPRHNLSVESRKILNNYVKSGEYSIPDNEDLQQKIFENIFYENLAKIKIACVLEQIIKKEDIPCNDKEIEECIKKIQDNPAMYQYIDLTSSFNKDNELVKSIVKQEKCIAMLKKNIIFSS